MKFHGIQMDGPFVNQRLTSLPVFNQIRDSARLVWLSDGSLWYGTDIKWVRLSGGRSVLTWSIVYSTTTGGDAEAGNGYFVDTRDGVVTINLPATAEIGDQIGITDYAGTFGTNHCILARNGHKIMGIEDNFEFHLNNLSILFAYVDVDQGWRIIYTADGAGPGVGGSDEPYIFTTTSSNKLLEDNEFCTVNVAGQTLTLPAAGSDGMQVIVAVGNFNDTVVYGNGTTIIGVGISVTLSTPNSMTTFIYNKNVWYYK